MSESIKQASDDTAGRALCGSSRARGVAPEVVSPDFAPSTPPLGILPAGNTNSEGRSSMVDHFT